MINWKHKSKIQLLAILATRKSISIPANGRNLDTIIKLQKMYKDGLITYKVREYKSLRKNFTYVKCSLIRPSGDTCAVQE